MKRPVLREKLSIKAPRPPKASSAAVSKAMWGNKASGTKPELALRQAVRKAGLKGARYNAKDVPGRPDLFYKAAKLAVFLNGCFWHRCPYCAGPIPKTNKGYWTKKFAANRQRDLRKRRRLRQLGASVLTIWECQLRSRPRIQVGRIRRKLCGR